MNPGSFLFYWALPVVAWLIISLRGNWSEYNELQHHRKLHPHERAPEKIQLDAEEERLLQGARKRAVRMAVIALAIVLGGTLLSTLLYAAVA
jgi:hypothetical protein